jgi:hypothetical protein
MSVGQTSGVEQMVAGIVAVNDMVVVSRKISHV